MENKQTIQEFDKFADSYAQALDDPIRRWFTADIAHFHQRKLDLILRILHARQLEPKQMRWIDVGCGRGELLTMGKAHFASVAGCDISAGMLAQGRGLDLRLQEDARRLPFTAAAADLVTAVCIFHHVEEEDRAALMWEMSRVLNPGGLMAVIEHNPFNPVTQWIVKRSPVDENAHLLTPRKSRRLLRSCGLRADGVQYFLYVPEKFHKRFGQLERALRKVPLGGQYIVLASKQAVT